MKLFIIISGLLLLTPAEDGIHVFFVDSEGWKSRDGESLPFHHLEVSTGLTGEGKIESVQTPLEIRVLDADGKPLSGKPDIDSKGIAEFGKILGKRVAVRDACLADNRFTHCTAARQDGDTVPLLQGHLFLTGGAGLLTPIEQFQSRLARIKNRQMPWMYSHWSFRTLVPGRDDKRKRSRFIQDYGTFNSLVFEIDLSFDQAMLEINGSQHAIEEGKGTICRLLRMDSQNECLVAFIRNHPDPRTGDDIYDFPPDRHFELYYRLLEVDPEEWFVPHPVTASGSAEMGFVDRMAQVFWAPTLSRCIPGYVE